MAKLWNNHMHTEFSGDSETPMLDMIQGSIKCGLQGITFTDHLDIDYYHSPGLFDLDIDSYRKCYNNLAEQYNSQLKVRWGIELGVQPHLTSQLKDIVRKYSFDYVIGSTHQVGKIDPYYPEYWEELGVKEGVREFFKRTYDNIEHFQGFDAYGHLDYILRYNKDAQGLNYEDYGDIVDEILKLLIRYNKSLEINTAAYKFGLTEPNPSMTTIKRYKELGGQLITLGSDAHIVEHIPVGYDKIVDVLKECGFNSYYVYKNRQPNEYEL